MYYGMSANPLLEEEDAEVLVVAVAPEGPARRRSSHAIIVISDDERKEEEMERQSLKRQRSDDLDLSNEAKRSRSESHWHHPPNGLDSRRTHSGSPWTPTHRPPSSIPSPRTPTHRPPSSIPSYFPYVRGKSPSHAHRRTMRRHSPERRERRHSQDGWRERRHSQDGWRERRHSQDGWRELERRNSVNVRRESSYSQGGRRNSHDGWREGDDSTVRQSHPSKHPPRRCIYSSPGPSPSSEGCSVSPHDRQRRRSSPSNGCSSPTHFSSSNGGPPGSSSPSLEPFTQSPLPTRKKFQFREHDGDSDSGVRRKLSLTRKGKGPARPKQLFHKKSSPQKTVTPLSLQADAPHCSYGSPSSHRTPSPVTPITSTSSPPPPSPPLSSPSPVTPITSTSSPPPPSPPLSSPSPVTPVTPTSFPPPPSLSPVTPVTPTSSPPPLLSLSLITPISSPPPPSPPPSATELVPALFPRQRLAIFQHSDCTPISLPPPSSSSPSSSPLLLQPPFSPGLPADCTPSVLCGDRELMFVNVYRDYFGKGNLSNDTNYLGIVQDLMSHSYYLPPELVLQLLRRLHRLPQVDIKRVHVLLQQDLAIRPIGAFPEKVWPRLEACLTALRRRKSQTHWLAGEVSLAYLLGLLLKELNTRLDEPWKSLAQRELVSPWKRVEVILDTVTRSFQAVEPDVQALLVTLSCLPLVTCPPLEREDLGMRLARGLAQRMETLESNEHRQHLLSAIPSDYLRLNVLSLHLEACYSSHPSAPPQGSQDVCGHLDHHPYDHDEQPCDLSHFLHLIVSLLQSHCRLLRGGPLVSFLKCPDPDDLPDFWLASSAPPSALELQASLVSVGSRVRTLINRLWQDEALLGQLTSPACWFSLQLLQSFAEH